jgi:hypothetical protein
MYPFPHLDRFVSYRIRPLRSLRRWLLLRGVGYVSFGKTEEEFWIVASKRIPLFSRPLTVEEVDRAYDHSKQWISLRAQLQAGDTIHPFAINVDTMAMRLGYVVLRKGKAIGGVVVVLS